MAVTMAERSEYARPPRCGASRLMCAATVPGTLWPQRQGC